jgi:uncharacterized protein YlxW (UPF0749 family)
MSSWSRIRWGLLAATIGFGVLLATQLQAVESPSRTLEKQSVDELTTLIGALTQETDRMQSELTDLSLRVMSARSAAESETTAITEQEHSLLGLRVVTGAIDGVGRGVSLTISDPQAQLEPYDLFTLVNELRSAGAEAVMIDQRRIGLRSNFTADPAGIALDGRFLREPYRLSAVGDPDDLSSSLRMPGGVIPSLENRAGVTVGLLKRDTLEVPAFSDEPTFTHGTALGG